MTKIDYDPRDPLNLDPSGRIQIPVYFSSINAPTVFSHFT